MKKETCGAWATLMETKSSGAGAGVVFMTIGASEPEQRQF